MIAFLTVEMVACGNLLENLCFQKMRLELLWNCENPEMSRSEWKV